MRAEENLFHKCPDRSLQTDKSSSRINSKQIAAFTLHSENEAVGEFEEFLSLFLSSVDSRVLAGRLRLVQTQCWCPQGRWLPSPSGVRG